MRCVVCVHFQPFSQSQSFIVMSSYKRISLAPQSRTVATHTGGEHKRLCWVHSNCADVVGVCLERCDLLGGVVVVYAHLKVIGAYGRTASASSPRCTTASVSPATIQFFLAMKRPARTGTSVSSNVLTIDWVMYDQMWTCPAAISPPPQL